MARRKSSQPRSSRHDSGDEGYNQAIIPAEGEKPFLRAIRADPNDNTVRLVYADWLDEAAGNSGYSDERREVYHARAKLIRAQVKLQDDSPEDYREGLATAAFWSAQ